MVKYLIVMSDGTEIIGRVKWTSMDVVGLEHPVFFIDLFQYDHPPEFVWYTKANIINFNRTALAYEYEPSKSIIDIYETYINSPIYQETLDSVDEILRMHLEKLKEPKTFKSKDTMVEIFEHLRQTRGRKLN